MDGEIGFIRVGLVSVPMARNLLKAVFEDFVWNLTSFKVDPQSRSPSDGEVRLRRRHPIGESFDTLLKYQFDS